MVGLNNPEGLFQTKLFCDSMIDIRVGQQQFCVPELNLCVPVLSNYFLLWHHLLEASEIYHLSHEIGFH